MSVLAVCLEKLFNLSKTLHISIYKGEKKNYLIQITKKDLIENMYINLVSCRVGCGRVSITCFFHFFSQSCISRMRELSVINIEESEVISLHFCLFSLGLYQVI